MLQKLLFQIIFVTFIGNTDGFDHLRQLFLTFTNDYTLNHFNRVHQNRPWGSRALLFPLRCNFFFSIIMGVGRPC
jgi:hypothetical protein